MSAEQRQYIEGVVLGGIVLWYLWPALAWLRHLCGAKAAAAHCKRRMMERALRLDKMEHSL